jgi:large subunit ribosomal protein L13e
LEPTVYSGGKQRAARGFSYQELKGANMNLRMAKRLGLRLDKRRSTVYEENIKLLKKRMEDERKKLEKKTKKGKKGKEKKTTKKADE